MNFEMGAMDEVDGMLNCEIAHQILMDRALPTTIDQWTDRQIDKIGYFLTAAEPKQAGMAKKLRQTEMTHDTSIHETFELPHAMIGLIDSLATEFPT